MSLICFRKVNKRNKKMEMNDFDLVQKLKENNQQLVLPLATKKKILKLVECQSKNLVVDEIKQELTKLRE